MRAGTMAAFQSNLQRIRGDIVDRVDEAVEAESLQRLYELCGLEYPLPSEKRAEARKIVLRAWNINQKRPVFANFEVEWLVANDSDKFDVEYRFLYWYRKIKRLEKIAKQEGWKLELTELPLKD